MSYRELEAAGLRLVVSEVAVRYRQPARYDDPVRIRCWVRELVSRRVDFGYAVEHADDGRLLATACDLAPGPRSHHESHPYCPTRCSAPCGPSLTP